MAIWVLPPPPELFVLGYDKLCLCKLIGQFLSRVQPGHKNRWMDDYCYGAAHEIYAGSFSKDFIGLTFTDAAE